MCQAPRRLYIFWVLQGGETGSTSNNQSGWPLGPSLPDLSTNQTYKAHSVSTVPREHARDVLVLMVLTYNSYIEGFSDNTRYTAFTYNGYWEQSFFRTWHLEIQTILLSDKKCVTSYFKRQLSFIYQLIQKCFTRILTDCWQDPNHCTISCCDRHLTGFKKDFSCLVEFCEKRMIIIRTRVYKFRWATKV